MKKTPAPVAKAKPVEEPKPVKVEEKIASPYKASESADPNVKDSQILTKASAHGQKQESSGIQGW